MFLDNLTSIMYIATFTASDIPVTPNVKPQPAPLSVRTDLSVKISHLQQLLMDYIHYRIYTSLQEYIKEGGNVNVQINLLHTRTTPLCEASKHYDTCAMNTLFQTVDCDINFQDGFGNTPLFQAARNRKSGSVQMLLQKGAEPDIENKWGITPLTVALENFSHHCAELLVEYGASVNVPIKSWSLQRQLPSYVKNIVSPLLFVLLSSPSPFPIATKLIHAGAFVEEIPEVLLMALLSRPGTSIKFMRLLIAAGFKLNCFRWIKEQRSELDLGLISEKNDQLLEVIGSSVLRPMTLQGLCRVCIRTCAVKTRNYRGHLRQKITLLELPKSTLAFLRMESL